MVALLERPSADPSKMVLQWEMNCASSMRLQRDFAIFEKYVRRAGGLSGGSALTRPFVYSECVCNQKIGEMAAYFYRII